MGIVRAAGWVLIVVCASGIPRWNAEGFAGEAPAEGAGSRDHVQDCGADALGLSPGAWLFLDGRERRAEVLGRDSAGLWHSSVRRETCARLDDAAGSVGGVKGRKMGDGELGGDEGGKWDLRVVESSFSDCSREAWINDTQRYQVGEHWEFSISREACARVPGQFSPPDGRDRMVILVDYDLPQAEILRESTLLLVAWLVEPEAVCPSCYDFVREHLAWFDLVMTHDIFLLRAAQEQSAGVFVNAAVPSIHPRHHQVYANKTSLVSMIVSHKAGTEGQRLRHQIAAAFGAPPPPPSGSGAGAPPPSGAGAAGDSAGIEVFGHSFRPLPDKMGALAGHMFHVVVENSRADCYFSEKLFDAVAAGAVPIYWGCERISEVLDSSGILFFDSLTDLAPLLAAASPELYAEMLPAVRRNLELLTSAYSNMSPLHQMWEGGGRRLAQRLAWVAISHPARDAAFSAGEPVTLQYVVRARAEQRSHAGWCAAVLLLNGLVVGSRHECAVSLLLPADLLQGENVLEVLLQEPESDKAFSPPPEGEREGSTGSGGSDRGDPTDQNGAPSEGGGASGASRVSFSVS
ncbi:hypothetical protein T484DRAFT_1915390 [Baffinella frigidus]|nr:hypothetical protein T484DRAFT_1915390 [Cryptophyta sp. CCMP2293]